MVDALIGWFLEVLEQACKHGSLAVIKGNFLFTFIPSLCFGVLFCVCLH